MRLVDDYAEDLSPAQLTDAALRLMSEYAIRLRERDQLHTLMDSWLGAYMLVDTAQSAAPPSRSRYYSPRAASIVDTSRRVLSQNPLRYRVSLLHGKAQAPESEIRASFSQLENVLHGVQYDIDRQLNSRGESDARSQVAFHGLVRGGWAYRMQLTADSKTKTSTGSPLDYQQYDPRLCLPRADKRGIESVVYFTMTTLAQLETAYPEYIAPTLKQINAMRLQRTQQYSQPTYALDYMYLPLLMLEWSSRDEAGTLVDLAGLPEEILQALHIDKGQATPQRFFWAQRPFLTGIDRSLIQYGNVNALPATAGTTQLLERAMSRSSPAGMQEWTSSGEKIIHGSGLISANGSPLSTMGNPQAVALADPVLRGAGRAIYSSVTHLFSDLNDTVVLLKDSIVHEVRGTWVLRTPNGGAVSVEIGTGKLNYLTNRSDLSKVDPHLQAPDMMQLAQIISQDISDATIDLRFILASESAAGGSVRARMEQAALLALVEYKDGVQDWAVNLGESFMAQYRKAGNAFGKWQLSGKQPGTMAKFFVVDVDDKLQDMLKGEGANAQPPIIEAAVKAAMPIDLMARINMAKSAIDPSNPVMGLAMALDTILEIDDVDSVYQEILQDMGDRNPTIMLFRIAEQFKKAGAPEVAQMILDDQFRSAFGNAMAAQQGRTATPTGGSPGILPENLPPEQSSGGATEPVNRGFAGRPGAGGTQLQLQQVALDLAQRDQQQRRFEG